MSPAGLRRLSAGFTLIEILVVVFIIGVILGFATLNLGGRALDDKVAEEARRLVTLFELARDESDLTGREIGWQRTEDGYRFVVLADGGWVDYAQSKPFRARPLDAPIRLKLEVDALEMSSSTDDLRSPQLIFFSSGELTPFTLTMDAPQLDVVYTITGNLLGQLQFERVSRDQQPFS